MYFPTCWAKGYTKNYVVALLILYKTQLLCDLKKEILIDQDKHF